MNLLYWILILLYDIIHKYFGVFVLILILWKWKNMTFFLSKIIIEKIINIERESKWKTYLAWDN